MSDKHQLLLRRTWTDHYPDTLQVSLQLDDDTGEPCVVFSGSAVFLTLNQATEVREFITECLIYASTRSADGGTPQ